MSPVGNELFIFAPCSWAGHDIRIPPGLVIQSGPMKTIRSNSPTNTRTKDHTCPELSGPSLPPRGTACFRLGEPRGSRAQKVKKFTVPSENRNSSPMYLFPQVRDGCGMTDITWLFCCLLGWGGGAKWMSQPLRIFCDVWYAKLQNSQKQLSYLIG